MKITLPEQYQTLATKVVNNTYVIFLLHLIDSIRLFNSKCLTYSQLNFSCYCSLYFSL